MTWLKNPKKLLEQIVEDMLELMINGEIMKEKKVKRHPRLPLLKK